MRKWPKEISINLYRSSGRFRNSQQCIRSAPDLGKIGSIWQETRTDPVWSRDIKTFSEAKMPARDARRFWDSPNPKVDTMERYVLHCVPFANATARYARPPVNTIAKLIRFWNETHACTLATCDDIGLMRPPPPPPSVEKDIAFSE